MHRRDAQRDERGTDHPRVCAALTESRPSRTTSNAKARSRRTLTSRSPTRPISAFDAAGTSDHNAFNCTPRAVLNVARDSMAHIGFSPATRVFEAAGAAACLITDAWEGIEQFLEPDEEVLVARDGQDVAEHLETLTEERARTIGEAALRRVLAGHTYALRGEQVHRIFQEHHQRLTEAA